MTTTPPAEEVSVEIDPTEDLDGQHFHCCAEWHLARLSPMCGLVHSFALRVSKNTGRFCPSAENVANYFHRDRTTILKAYVELREAGFFELLYRARGQAPNTYKVLTHKQWAAKHPNKCALKAEYPWTGESQDTLAQNLSMRVGGAIRFPAVTIKNIRAMRRRGKPLTDRQIARYFDFYYRTAGQHRKARAVPAGFYLWLKPLMTVGKNTHSRVGKNTHSETA